MFKKFKHLFIATKAMNALWSMNKQIYYSLTFLYKTNDFIVKQNII